MIFSYRQEIKEVMSTAWPLMLSTGLFSITLFVDRLLLYSYSNAAASAALGAGIVLWSLNCLPIGICGYTNAFVAQYLAARRPKRALQVVWQGILLAISIGPLLFIMGYYSEQLYTWIGHAPALAKLESDYFIWLVPGTWASIIASSLVGLFAGSNRSLALLFSDFIVTIVNAVLDFVLIFGWFGFPAMGVKGAAIASSIALVLKLIILAWLASHDFRFVSKLMRSYRLDAEMDSQSKLIAWDWPLMRRLIHYGWPAGVSSIAEAWSFTFIMMLVGRLGEQAVAATTLALNVNLIAFIPLIGLGTGVGVLVGKYLVEGDVTKTKRIVLSGLVIGITYSLVFVVLYGGFPEWVMTIYALEEEPERFEAMKPVLKPLLYFIAGYCVFDSLQLVFVGALKGAGDTFFVLAGHVLSGAVAVIGGLAISHWTGNSSLYFWWAVITAWVVLLAGIFTVRYLHGGWLSKRVIEPQVVD